MSDPDSPRTVMGMSVNRIRPAAEAAEVARRHASNREAWNQGALGYRAELEETIERLRGGWSNLHPVERRNLGDFLRSCKVAVHVQCASGADTLSLLNEGVERVIGVDISDRHIENARRMTAALGANATWHRCDVLELPAELDAVADLVYTGRGALCWLHDLPAWGRAVHRLLRPGAIVHVLDDHPVSWLFDPDADELRGSGDGYFDYSESSRGWPDTYLGDLGMPLAAHALKYERTWTLAEIFSALAGAGLVVEHLGEHPESYWDSLPNLPDAARALLPMTFSMIARRPA